MNRFAVISDIHGNRWALEAVLEDIERNAVDAVFNLGDVFYGPLDPAGTAALLNKRQWPTVRGNEDRIITDESAPLNPTLRFVRGQLGTGELRWLRTLEPCLVVGEAYLCHASPGADTRYLMWDIGQSGANLRAIDAIEESLGGIDQRIILCGHDHVPKTMDLGRQRLLVNPGSVGLPAYSDDVPHDHVMETGSTPAHYAVLTRCGGGWSVSDRAVPYDWRTAATAARNHGRTDWAQWLSTGRAVQPGRSIPRVSTNSSESRYWAGAVAATRVISRLWPR